MHIGTFQPCHTHLAWELTVVTKAMAKSTVGRRKARRRNLPLGWRGSDRSTCGGKKESGKSLIFNIQLIVNTNITNVFISQLKTKMQFCFFLFFFLCGTHSKPWTQHDRHPELAGVSVKRAKGQPGGTYFRDNLASDELCGCSCGGNGKIAQRGRTHAIRIWQIRWQWVAGSGEGDTGGAKERERGTTRQGPTDETWFSWKLAFCALGKRLSLSAGWGLSSPALVTAAQMSIKLAPIYYWFARVICNIPSLPLMGWHRDEGVMGGEKRGEEKMEGESLYCSLSPWMSSAHLLCVPVGQREGGEEEERRSFVPWSGSLAHANRAAVSGESLARVLMELGQTHFTA